jgi:intein-encoded DNA endonuclease-like protein
VDEATAYIVGALEDGGCYALKYSNKRSEYRCVWVQKDEDWLKKSVMPRLRNIMKRIGDKSRLSLRCYGGRSEVRVSSKKIYQYLRSINISSLINESRTVRIAWLRGFYDAEGDKSGRRIRLWNKDLGKLQIAGQLLEELGISVYGPFLDDKRHNVYVIEVPSSLRSKFLALIRPEHPKMTHTS